VKKGFTLIELIFVMIVLSVITVLSINSFIENKKNKEINALVKKIVDITQNYVLDTNYGYLNGSGDYCSDDNTFNKVDAYRAIQCAGFLNKPFSAKTYNSDDAEKNGANTVCNYIIIPTKVLSTDNGVACRIHYTFDSSDTNILYVGINCSYLNNARKRELLEKLLISAFRQNFPSIYEAEYPKWTINESAACSQDDNNGANNDGELKFKLKIN